MSIADKKYKELINDIYLNGIWDSDKNVRAKYADGVPAYSKSVFGRQITFEEGEIPLLTCKKMFPITAIKEMILFWVQQSTKQEDFEAVGCKVWDEWFDKESKDLGKSYAYQFESLSDEGELVEVEPVILVNNGFESKIKYTDEFLKFNKNSDSKYVGKIQNSDGYGKYLILDYIDKKFKIQFLTTGYIKYVDSSTIYSKNVIIDNYVRNIFSIGYLGDITESIKDDEDYKKHYRRWYHMLERCYDINSKEYHNYGGKGIFVCERWHNFSNFIKDIKTLPQYFIAKRENFLKWDLDKDYYSSNCYSIKSCIWLTNNHNVIYRNNPISIELTHVDGKKEKFLSISDAQRKYNISNLDKVLKGTRKNKTQFKISKLETNNPLRYKLSKNQVVELINNIKNNPASKRLMTSFWNYKDVESKALQECAMQTTWYVRGNSLDLLLYSRSCDSGLGLPFNWFQYKILQMIISKVTGYNCGKFIHQIGNLHYYDRHEETLLKQLELEEFNDVEIKLKDKLDFFEYDHTDIIIENYNCGPFLNMEVAI